MNTTQFAVPIVGVIFFAGAAAQDPGQKLFYNPADASKALYDAVKTGNTSAIETVLGSSSHEILSSGDQVQDKTIQADFERRYAQMNRWAKDTDGSMTLYVGAENWPMPIPLKKGANGQWYFDSKAGAQEILYRRIGNNEFSAIRTCGALAEAQIEYYKGTYPGDGVHQYAQKILSDPGQMNGLYWKAASGQAESPIGPLVAQAAGEGYKAGAGSAFHGYFYRLLTNQGARVFGGAKSHIVNGKMTGGFALIAFPAVYRNSGVMTFLVDSKGVIYEKDLGPQTASLASAMTSFNPDATWRKVRAEEEDTAEAEDTAH